MAPSRRLTVISDDAAAVAKNGVHNSADGAAYGSAFVAVGKVVRIYEETEYQGVDLVRADIAPPAMPTVGSLSPNAIVEPGNVGRDRSSGQ